MPHPLVLITPHGTTRLCLFLQQVTVYQVWDNGPLQIGTGRMGLNQPVAMEAP